MFRLPSRKIEWAIEAVLKGQYFAKAKRWFSFATISTPMSLGRSMTRLLPTKPPTLLAAEIGHTPKHGSLRSDS